MDAQPTFRYHPDPVATGSAVATDEACSLCHRPAGLRYEGPIFGAQADVVCLRCIADGSAAVRLGVGWGPADFTDVGVGVPDGIPTEVLDEVAQRTPGFHGWQQEHWMYHCNDAAAYLGRAGWDDLQERPEALDTLRDELSETGLDDETVERHVHALDADGDATAYLFRCLHCGTHLAYSDLA